MLLLPIGSWVVSRVPPSSVSDTPTMLLDHRDDIGLQVGQDLEQDGGVGDLGGEPEFANKGTEEEGLR